MNYPSPPNQILIYAGDNGQPVIEVQTDGETVWFTQAQLTELFSTSKQNIFQEGELSREKTVKEYLIVRTKRNRKISKDAETEDKKYQATILKKSLAEQARIVSILDKFDTLTHSISEDLPREIALRQKQYAYYCYLLLNFPLFPSPEGVAGEA